MSPNAEKHKCEGIGCAYKNACGRFLRPDAGQDQAWGSYYALAGDDCGFFEPVVGIAKVVNFFK